MASMAEIASLFDASSVFLLISTLVVFLIPVFILFPPIPVERSDALQQTHSKLGLADSQSNLRTQNDHLQHGARSGRPGTIQSLYVYPIKSCRGVELSQAKVLSTGLQHDRLYTFAQFKEPAPIAGEGDATASSKPGSVGGWEFLTQRQLPLLANVHVDVWLPDPKKSSRQLGRMDSGFIVAKFPWTDKGLRGVVQRLAAKLSRGLSGVPEKEIMLPLEFPSQHEITARGYEYAPVKVWKETVSSLNMEKELPAELAEYLGAKNRLALFRVNPDTKREVFRCAPRKDEAGYQPVVDFQDAYPLHLLSLTSMQALETKVIKDEGLQELCARRFRANIIISGTEAYDEDHWKRVSFKRNAGKDTAEAESIFAVSCRTVRCKLPNVDPATGIRHNTEPDRSLRKFRDIDEGAPRLGCFGMQLCPHFPDAENAEHLESLLETGMEIDVLERGSQVYINQ